MTRYTDFGEQCVHYAMGHRRALQEASKYIYVDKNLC